MSQPHEQSRSRGPRQAHRLGPQRNPDIDTAVLSAARELIAERGYYGASVDAIARRADVGRPTVYRRWPSKAHIVHDAVYPSVEPAPFGTTDAAQKVAALVSGAYELFGTPAARAGVPGLMSDTRSDPQLHDRLVTEQIDPVREVVRRLVADGVADGTLRSGVDVDTIVDVLAGAAIFAMSVRNSYEDEALASRLTDLLLYGLVSRD